MLPAVSSYLLLYGMFLVACGVLGLAAHLGLQRRFSLSPLTLPNLSTAVFVYATTGIGLFITILFLLGLFHALNATAIAIAMGIVFMGTMGYLWFYLNDFPQALGCRSPHYRASIWVLPIAIYCFGLLLKALCPPVGWDELSYHLPYARFYLENGGLGINEFLRYPFQTHNFNLLYSFALLISDERLAHLIHGGSALLIVAGLYGLARVHCGDGVAILAVLTLLSFKAFRLIIPTAYVDLGFTLFVWLAVFALVHWVSNNDQQRWLYTSAFAAGIGMGVKYIGSIFPPMLAIWVFIHSRNIRQAVVYALIVLLFGGWWYARSLVLAGNPVHPFAADIFGYYLWDAGDLAGQYGDLERQAPGRGLWAPLIAPIWFIYEATKNETTLLSVLALPFFFSPLFYFHLPRALRPVLLVAFAYYLLWAWILGPVRYLMPIMPLIALVSAATVARMLRSLGSSTVLVGLRDRMPSMTPRLRIMAVTLAIIGASVETVVTVRTAQTWPWTDHDLQNYYLTRVAGYELFQVANESQAIGGAPVYQIGFENLIYFYKGLVVGDWFGIARYRSMVTQDAAPGQYVLDLAAAKEMLNRFSAKAILINERSGLLHYDKDRWSQYFELIKASENGSLWLLRNSGVK